MKCPECGKEVADTLIFCSQCGYKLKQDAQPANMQEQTNTAQYEQVPNTVVANTVQVQPGAVQEAPKKKKGKGGLIAVLIIVLLLILGAGGYYAYITLFSTVAKIDKALSEQDTDEVVNLYSSITNEKDADVVAKKALDYVASIKDSYINEEEGFDYNTVTKNITKLQSEVLKDNDDVQETLDYIAKINDSRAAYSTANNLYLSEKYAASLPYYDQVIADDAVYYDKAKTEKADALDKYVASVLKLSSDYKGVGDYASAYSELTEALDTVPGNTEINSELIVVKDDLVNNACKKAKDLEKSGEYDEAQSVLEEALAIVPDDQKLTKELANVEKQMVAVAKKEQIDKIKGLQDEQKYDEAFKALDAAVKKYGDSDSDVMKIKSSLVSAYKSEKLAEIGECEKNNDINGALEIIKEMSGFLPDDEDVASLSEKYEKLKPVNFFDIEPYSRGNYAAELTIGVNMVDTYNNEYKNSVRAKPKGYYNYEKKNTSIAYLINGEYQYLSGTIAFENSLESKGAIEVEIYSDDKMVYSSSIVDKDTKPISFEAELGEECHYVYLVVQYPRGYSNNKGIGILDNFQLHN